MSRNKSVDHFSKMHKTRIINEVSAVCKSQSIRELLSTPGLHSILIPSCIALLAWREWYDISYPSRFAVSQTLALIHHLIFLVQQMPMPNLS